MVFAKCGAFRRDLDEAVEQHFRRTGQSRFAPVSVWLKTTVLLTTLAASYVALVFVASTPLQALAAGTAVGVLMALVGFNVQHDGGHRAYSDVPGVNRAMAFSLDVLGGSSYFWRFKHNIAHHTYPNISGWDDDIFIGILGRLSPQDRRCSFHRFQHLYMWVLYALLALKWQLIDDFRFIIKPGIAKTHVPRPRGLEHALFWLGKAAFFALALALPLTRHSFADVALVITFIGAVAGLVLGVVFQLAHCVPEAAYGTPGCDGHLSHGWSQYQVESSVDFAQDNALVTWLLGGLNFQIEHHLFPRICHGHYPALAPLVREVCARHDVRYSVHPSFMGAVRAHTSWLRRLGCAQAS